MVSGVECLDAELETTATRFADYEILEQGQVPGGGQNRAALDAMALVLGILHGICADRCRDWRQRAKTDASCGNAVGSHATYLRSANSFSQHDSQCL